MVVSKASGAITNTSCYENGIGKVILGLDSHLDPKSIHRDCIVRRDSDCKNHRNNTCSWCDWVKCSNNIDIEIIDRCEGLMTVLKTEKVSPLEVTSNTSEWFCIRRFSFILIKSI